MSRASPPAITVQPRSKTVIVGSNYTFRVTATGSAPLSYQWQRNGSVLGGETNTTLPLVNVQTNDAGAYQVIITNVEGLVTSAVARLAVRLPSDPSWPDPQGGWAYLYSGDALATDGAAALDGTWNHDNISDSWAGDGRGAGNEPAGGLSTTNGWLTIEDAVSSGSLPTDNRRLYFTHNVQQDLSVTNPSSLMNDGVTLSFRARLTPATDPWIEITNAPNGYVNHNDGRGMFGIRQGGDGGAIISFSLNQSVEDGPAGTFNFGQAGLHMNYLNGNGPSSFVDPGEGGSPNLLPLDPTLFHHFWITLQANAAGPGTHRVSVYLDGSQTPAVFYVTAGTASDISQSDSTSTNYLALGLGSTVERGAVDVDFFGYQPGVILPSGFDTPVSLASQPSNAVINVGQVATFNVSAAGTPPVRFQWYRNGDTIPDATNAVYSTPPTVGADQGAQFSAVAYNDFSGVTSAVATIIFYAPPLITQPPQSQAVNYGGSATFSVTATGGTPLNYQWRFNGNRIANATNNVFSIAPVQPTDAGDYDVVVTNIFGSVTSAVATLTVRLPPTITIPPASLTVTQGNAGTFSVTATGYAPLSYQWRFNNGTILNATNLTLVLDNVQPGQAGNYDVVVANSVGSATSAVATLTVRVPPAIAFQPVSMSVTQGNTATFSVTATGDTPLNYQWQFNGNSIPEATNAVLTLSNAQPAQAGGYSAVVANNINSVTSTVAQLTVRIPPSITTQPMNLAVSRGHTATFTVAAIGDAPLGYQWRFNGTNLAGAINTALTLTNAQLNNAGNYDVVVANNVGSVTSVVTTLTIGLPPTITVQPQCRTVVLGDSYAFTVTVTGDTPFSYQWRRNSIDLLGQTNSTLPLTNIQTNDAGSYQVVVTNSEGSVVSEIAHLFVRSPSAPSYADPQGGWTYLLTGDSAATNGNVAFDGTWYWNNSSDSWAGDGRGAGNAPAGGVSSTGGILTIEDAVNATSGGLDNRRIYLLHNLQNDSGVTNANTLLDDGVTLRFRARLTPPGDPLIELTNAPNGYVNNAAGKGVFGLRQSGSGGMIISFSLNQAVEDTGVSTTFNFGQAGLHMNSLNGDVRSSAVDPTAGGTLNLLPLDPTVFHDFWITIQGNGAAPGTHQVSVYLDGSLTPANFNVTAGAGFDSSQDDPAMTNYLALGLSSIGQRGAVDVDYFGYRPGAIAPPPLDVPAQIVAQPVDILAPEGQAAVFSVSVTGTPQIVFQWFKNGSPISDATNAAYTTPPTVAGDNGSLFTVTASNACGSVTSTPAALWILLHPQILVQPQSLVVTNGDPANFSVSAVSGATLTYQWRFNGTNLPGATSSNLLFPFVQPGNAGAYDVVVANAAGASTSAVATLTIRLFNFGNAPLPYPTLLADNGARHLIVPGVYLGLTIDTETNGLPGSGVGLDEDGVQFTAPLVVGQTATAQVVASTNGFIDAWMDFNGNGSWADPGDQIFTHQSVAGGTNRLSFLVPLNASVADTYTRFRFSQEGGLSFVGAAANGEVEDYPVAITLIADLSVAQAHSPEPVAVGSNLIYSLTVNNSGPSPANGVMLTDTLPVNVIFVSAASSQGNCSNASGVVTCALGRVNPGASASVTITVSPTSLGTSTNIAGVNGAPLDPVASNNVSSANATVLNPPSIITPPISLTVTQGQTAVFNVVGAGSSPNYQWRFNGADLVGQTNTTLQITNARPANAGTYTVRVSNDAAAVESAPATLTVLVPPVILIPPPSQTNLGGATVTFNVTATGTAPLSYQWFFNDTNALPFASNATLVITNAQTTHMGVYRVQVINSAGAVLSAAATLTILNMDFGDAPDPPYPTRLANNGARHRVAPGVFLGAKIDWEPEGQANATATGDDLNGLADEDGVVFTTPLMLGQQATVLVIASTNGFLDAWLDFNANGSWADAGDQIFNSQPLVPGTNTLTFAVPPNAALGATFARFRFSTAGHLSFAGEALDGEVEDYAVNINQGLDLVVTQTVAPVQVVTGGSLTYTILVTNQGPLVATAVALSDLLPGSAVFNSAQPSQGSCTINGGLVSCSLSNLNVGGSATVVISVTTTFAGVLTNVATVSAEQPDVNPANNSAPAISSVLDLPAITTPPANAVTTNGYTAAFTVAATGTALHYQWQFGSSDIPGATNAILNLANVQASQAGPYRARVFNALGSVLSEAATLTVLLTPVIVVPPQSQTSMIGGTVSFSVTATGTPPLIYQWQFNGANLIGAVDPMLTLTNVTPDNAGLFTVLVINPVGSITSAPAILTVIVPPEIAVSPRSATNYAGSTAVLTVIASGTPPMSYQWYFNGTNALTGATNGTLALTNVQKIQAGDYYVTVANRAGRVDSSHALLTVWEADFGNAPDPPYPTLLANNGARHLIVPGVHLGATIDFEPDGQPNASATGDNLRGLADDDGVQFLTPLRVGQMAAVQVVASTNGFLDAWIDFSQNGSWAEFSDQIFISQPLVAGTNQLTFPVPASAQPGVSFGRFRFSTTGGLSYDGLAMDGEVEDYQVNLEAAIDLVVTQAVDSAAAAAGSLMTYTLSIVNQGFSTASSVTLSNVLPFNVSFVSASALQGGCTNYANTIVCSLGSLPSGTSTVVTIAATALRSGEITNAAAVTANEFDVNLSNNVSLAPSLVVDAFGPFVNTNFITLVDFNAASPYPSSVAVSGLTEAVQKVTVTVSNLNHTFPKDIDLLLVGPSGQNVMLMAQAGGSSLQNVTVTFDDAAPNPVPASGHIRPGAYQPANYADASLVFSNPAPVGPYGASLSVFNGTNPNGVWSLYAMDDSPQDSGFIANGWSLNLATLHPLADLAIAKLASSDPTALGSNLTYTITVTNQGPADATGVQLADRLPASVNFVSVNSSQGGCSIQSGVIQCALGNLASGQAAVVTLVATANALGLTTNTATVSANEVDANLDNNSATALTTIKLVTDLALSMKESSDTLLPGQQLAYTLAVTNRGPNPATAVRLTDTLPANVILVSAQASTGSCSNQNGSVYCDLGNLGVGARAAVSVVIQPVTAGMISNLACVASDLIDFNPANNVAVQSAAVLAGSATFATTNAITITNLGTATPYPSTLLVSGLTATVYKVTATLSNLTASAPQHFSVLLVGPSGQAVMLMSRAGGSNSLTRVTLTFDDAATAALSNSLPIVSGTYRPTDGAPGAVVFPLPAPAANYRAALAAFSGTDPNGAWSLYVLSDSTDSNVAILGGWNLTITTVEPLLDPTVTMVALPDPIVVRNSLTYAITVANRGYVSAPNVSLIDPLPLGVSFVSAMASQGSCANNGGVLRCDFGNLDSGATSTVTLVVIANASGLLTNCASVSTTGRDFNPANNTATTSTTVMNVPPVISAIPNRPMNEDASTGPIPVVIGDVETPANLLTLAGQSSNTNLVPNANIIFNGSGSNRTVTLTPAPQHSGTATITLTVDDGNGGRTSASFVLTVLPLEYPPAISVVPDTTTAENTPVAILFTVSDVETPAANLVVSGYSSNPALVPNANLVFSGSGSNRTVTIAPTTNQFGSALIVLAVTDGDGNVADTRFTLTVPLANHTPTLDPLGDMTINEDSEPQSVVLWGITSGVPTENQTLTVTADSSNPSVISNLAVLYTSPQTAGLLSFAPVLHASGSAIITVSVNDGSNPNNLATRSFTVTVTPTNDPPVIADIADQVTFQDTAKVVAFTVSDVETPANNLTVTGTSSDTNLVPLANVVLGGTDTNRTVTITPAAGKTGWTTITLTVTDGSGSSATNFFLLAVAPFNHAPILSGIVAQSTSENTPITFGFGVGDLETPASALVVSGSTANPVLVPNANLVFGGSGSNRTITLTPAANQYGTGTLTLVVRDADGLATSNSFLLAVTPTNQPPRISSVPNLTMAANTVLALPFAVDDRETPTGSLTLSATSSNAVLLPASNIVFGGSGVNRTATLAPLSNQIGTASITFTVADGNGGTASSRFVLTVNPPQTAPVITVQPQNQTVTNGADAVFSVTATGTLPLSYQWRYNNTNMLDATNAILRLANIQTSDAGTYSVLVANAFGVARSSSAALTVLAGPLPPAITLVPMGAMWKYLDTGTNLGTAWPAAAFNDSAWPAGPAILGYGMGNEATTVSFGPVSTNKYITTYFRRAFAVSNPALFTNLLFRLLRNDGAVLDLNNNEIYRSNMPTGAIAYLTLATNAVVGTDRTNYFTSLVSAGGLVPGTNVLAVEVHQVSPTSPDLSFDLQVQGLTRDLTHPGISTLANQTTSEATPLTLPFTVSDWTVPPFLLTVTATSTNTALVPNANLFLDGSTTNRTLTLQPAAYQYGTTLITLTVSNGQASANSSFVLTVNSVNNHPTLDPLPDVSVTSGFANFAVPFTGITSGAPNENQTTTVSVVSSNTAVVAINSVSYTAGAASGSVTLKRGTTTGSAVVAVTVNDGVATNNTFTQQFTVYVKASANAVPTLSAIANRTISENTSAGPITFTVGDDQTPAASLVVFGKSSNPSLVPTNNLVFGGSGTNRTLTVTPAPNQSGTATITVLVTDTGFGMNSTNFVLTVNPVNSVPQTSSIPDQTILENTSTGPIPYQVSDVETPAANLVVTASSANPTLVPNANIRLGGSGTNRALSLTPAPNQAGTAQITVTVSDGTSNSNQTFQLTVQAVNSPPMISDIADQATNEETPITIAFTVGDLETPASNLVVSAVSSNPALVPNANFLFAGANSNRTVTITPATNQVGVTLITVTVADDNGASGSMSFLLNVRPVNHPPTLNLLTNLLLNLNAGPQTVSLTGITTGAPNENQVLAVSAVSSNPLLVPDPPVNYSSPNAAGTLILQPLSGATGTATIAVTVSDGQNQNATVTRSFTVTVTPFVTVSSIADQMTGQDTVLTVPFTVNGVLMDASSLVVTAVSSNPILVPNANLALSGSGANRLVALTPAASQLGFTTITLTAVDTNGNAASSGFVLVVRALNHPPTLAPIGDLAIFKNAGPQTVPLAGISSGAPNENQTLVVSARSSNPALIPHPAVNYSSPASTGTLLFTPVTNATGTATLTVTVNDLQPTNATTTQTFHVTVTPTHHPPMISAIPDQGTDEDVTKVVAFAVGDLDTPAGSLTVGGQSSNTNLVPNANLVFSGSGSNRLAAIAPAPHQSGVATITFTVTNGVGASASASFVLTVNPVNTPPAISSIADQTIAENSPALPLAFSVFDAETPATNLTVTGHAANASLVSDANIRVSGSGNNRLVQITPLTNQFGSTLITITVRDGQGGTAGSTFVLTVNRVNQAPTISAVPDQTMRQDTNGVVAFAVGDVETPAGLLMVSGSSSNPSLVPDANLIFGGSSPNRTVTFTPLPGQSGAATITLTVTDADGATASTSFLVTVFSLLGPPTIAMPPQNQTVLVSAATVFCVTVYGSEPLSYQWQRNGTPLSGQTNAILTLAHTKLDDAGDYRVMVSNQLGSTNSTAARLRVLAAPSIATPTRAGTTVNLAFTTVSGLIYTVEYQEAVNNAHWHELPPVTGTGDIVNVTDSAATSPTRLYRVRVE